MSLSMSLRRGLIFTLASVITVASLSCMPGPPAKAMVKVPNVEVWSVETIDLEEEISLPGLLQANRTIRLSAEVAAPIRKVLVDVGANVEKGQVLVRFDDTDLSLMVKQAAAQVASLKARIKDVERGAREQQIKEAEAGLGAARAALETAKTIHERRVKLVAEKLLPREATDQTRLQLQQAQAGYDRAREMIDLLKEGATEETLASMRAQLEAAEHGVQLAANRVQKAVVKSPLKGVVIKRFVDDDEYAGPGSPLFDIIPETPITVSLGVPERIFGKLKKHDRVRIGMPVLDIEIESEITMLAPAANPRTQTFAVEIEIDNPIRVPAKTGVPARVVPLRPGLIADVTFSLGRHRNTVAIPNDALIMDEDLLLVMLQTEENGKTIAKTRPVMIGMKKGGLIEITDGLEPGEKLIVEGQKYARDGEEVKVVLTHQGPPGSLTAKPATPENDGGAPR